MKLVLFCVDGQIDVGVLMISLRVNFFVHILLLIRLL